MTVLLVTAVLFLLATHNRDYDPAVGKFVSPKKSDILENTRAKVEPVSGPEAVKADVADATITNRVYMDIQIGDEKVSADKFDMLKA